MKQQRTMTPRKATLQETQRTDNSLDVDSFREDERKPVRPQGPFTHWLSVEQIRKMQRMRRQAVIRAMEAGDLPHERRGRIRYARLSDVIAWEERRLARTTIISRWSIDPDLLDLAG